MGARAPLFLGTLMLAACVTQSPGEGPETTKPEAPEAASHEPTVWLEAEHFDAAEPEPEPPPRNSPIPAGFEGEALQVNVDADGLERSDYALGEGPEAAAGSKLRLHYEGVLPDGTVFDSTHERDRPFEFELGQGRVIEGFERGLVGVRVGMRRKLVIPPQLGYGERKTGSIPPNSTLIFYIEVVNVESLNP
ncbi:FKBP-type peptidyl-prolyl cis-trans isomerase [Plesiocystis pacifica SIR-1]|uniref:Peptidyl-prolyl cis-trans isomerase n=1 Tax=Plesiocystis pacifica SIR-1 TaxID=391625 RepID=A6G3Y3_9BACT|nr:FKBP-type peptidyl-prolyl cis-trans isomerase [Plesiocystis pacifica]EDM79520.1 FKBP-type peptidyl-prolyl cis-trans isomerase [Plesiocystis pacifica SIR-1]